MKKWRDIWEGYTGSVRSRTILMVLLAGVCSLTLAAGAFLFRYHQDMTEAYRRQVRLHLTDVDVVFNSFLDHAAAITQSWFFSPDGKLACLDEQYNKFEHMRFIQQVQRTLTNSTWIQSAYFFSKDGETALYVKGEGSRTEEMDALLLERLKTLDVGDGPFVWRVKQRYGQEETALLTVFTSETNFSSQQWTGAVAVNIELSRLQKKILSQAFPSTDALWILDENGIVALHSDMSLIGQDWSKEAVFSKIRESRQQAFQMEMQGRDCEIIAIPSRREGFWIVAQSGVNAGGAWGRAMGLALLIFPVSILLMCWMTLALGKRIFQPLSRTVDSMRRTGDTLLMPQSGGGQRDELRFLSAYAAYIEEYVNKVRQSEEKARILRHLLSLEGDADPERMLMEGGLMQPGCECRAVTAAFYLRRESRELQEVSRLGGQVRQAFGEELEEMGACVCFEYGLHRYLFLLSVSEEERNGGRAVKQALEKARQRLAQQREDAEIYGCVSRKIRCGEGGLREAVRENNERLEVLRLCRREDILLPEEGEENALAQADAEEGVVKALKEGNRQRYEEAVEELLEKTYRMTHLEFSRSLTRLSRRILKVKASMETAPPLQTEDALYEKVRRLESREGIAKWFEWLYDDVNERMDEVKGGSAARMMEKAVEYILDHFQDDALDVTLLASRLHITPQYFGQMFRAFTGENAVDYIIRIRMEKARDYLLTQPEMEIGQVAQRVGYRSPAYFSTAFKKYYGVSPTRLRSSLHLGNRE